MHPVLKAFFLIIHVQIIDRFSPSGPEYRSCQIQLNHLLLNAFCSTRFAVFPISIVNEHQNCAEGPFLTGCIIQPANEERKVLIAKELKNGPGQPLGLARAGCSQAQELSLLGGLDPFTPRRDRERKVFLLGGHGHSE